MTPVFQDTFYDPTHPINKQRGNCFSACLASLLDLPLRAVPNFVEIDELGGPNWWWHADKYLGLLGYSIEITYPKIAPSGYYIMSGLSPRSVKYGPFYHAVIGKEGKMVHDPHPNGEGLMDVSSIEYLKRTGFRY